MNHPKIYLESEERNVVVNHNGVEHSLTMLVCIDGNVILCGSAFKTQDDLLDGFTLYKEELEKAIINLEDIPHIQLKDAHSN